MRLYASREGGLTWKGYYEFRLFYIIFDFLTIRFICELKHVWNFRFFIGQS